MERKLASIRIIDNIEPISGADAIEVATIGGWKVVVKKGEFKIGQLAIYFEIDSWIPHELAPFLSKGSIPREYNGIKGERLRTIRLRGQVSQGLLLPTEAYEIELETQNSDDVYYVPRTSPFEEGEDLTELLFIQKWEAPVSANMAGKVKGSFPSYIRKTDQERAQNLLKEIFEENKETEYEVTIKLDGSSMTVYHVVNNDTDILSERVIDQGVCSRNLNLKLDQEGNTFVDVAKNSGLLGALFQLDKSIAVQGELMGPGIQHNREGLKEHEFYVYDIWDINNQCYFPPYDRNEILQDLANHGARFKHVPILFNIARIKDMDHLGIHNIEGLLDFAKGKSINNPVREGLVFKSTNGDFSFKAISNEFLLGEK